MRIIRDYNICILLRPHEWDIVNYYSPVNNSSFLEIEVVSKMCKKCFFKSKLIDLKSRFNFMSCLKDQGCFQSPSESLFSNYPLPPPPILVEILCRQNPHVSTKEAIKFFWVCLRYILGPHLITRNGYWIRSLSSPTPIYSKPLCSITQCNVMEFSCYKFKGKRTNKHISNIRKFFGNFINLMCDLLNTNFSLSLSFSSTLGY